MSAATRMHDPPRLLCLCIGTPPIGRLRHGRRRKALLFEGRLTNAGITAPMSDANDSPVGKDEMTVAQHGEAPNLYCDRMDEKKKCANCGRGTHLRFQRPGYPDVIAYFWKCRRCIRKGTSSEREALARMLFRDKRRLFEYLSKSRVEVGGLTD